MDAPFVFRLATYGSHLATFISRQQLLMYVHGCVCIKYTRSPLTVADTDLHVRRPRVSQLEISPINFCYGKSEISNFANVILGMRKTSRASTELWWIQITDCNISLVKSEIRSAVIFITFHFF
jgi:hypothetical protein